uniref:DOT1 domain-containing protein n=1 Tax=viral metagenome TaxID=1070528 RepID=A0A6C0AYW3_9ZZZZ
MQQLILVILLILLILVFVVFFVFFKFNSTFSNIKKKYPKIKYIFTDKDKYSNYKITYGEMTYNGIDKLYKSLDSKFEYFLDLGSGNGHLCLYMAEKPEIKKSVGIEIVTERYEFANTLKTDNVSFINDDILNINIKDLFDKPVFVWWSNLCFSKESIDKIAQKLLSELKPGSIICCSNPINYKLHNKKKAQMSWGKNSEVYIYKLE